MLLKHMVDCRILSQPNCWTSPISARSWI